jgi:NADH-quinone oxidoreductase subunit L
VNPWLIAQFLWIVPAIPLVASLIVLSLKSSRRKAAAAIAIGGQAISLILSIAAFVATLGAREYHAFCNFTWFTAGYDHVQLGWLLDPLTAVMLVMVTLVSLCIFVFSVGYMADDEKFTRFFAYLSFFTAAMLGVVIANSLLLLFVCWELVGLASYLLIGFWIEKPSAAAAAKKAFITTRIGDLGFFLGMLWIWNSNGTLIFFDGGSGCLEPAALQRMGSAITLVALLIFCGAMGKSGQFPLHVWLPDAMEGPTPVSALIHAATMVAAGVFLVARTYPLFVFGGVQGVTPSLTVVVWIGVITALMASLIAVAQVDIKRILAYSTVSQLGLMMVSLGVGGVAAGIVHLVAHAFFKALLFLGSGSVIHGCHGEQDIRKMGGLRTIMPVTFFTYAIGMMALSGVPLFFCGAWSKEAILDATHRWPTSNLPWVLMVLGVVLTAFYMTRQMIYVFFGQSRSAASGAHESSAVMLVPLIVLAGCTVIFSVVLSPAWPWMENYLAGDHAHLHWSELLTSTVFVSLILVGGGIAAAALVYRRVDAATDPLEKAQPSLFRFLKERMWIDALYERTVIPLAEFLARLSDWLDRNVWDGFVRLFASVGQLTGILTRGFDERGINAGVDEATTGARDLGWSIGRLHSGKVQGYLGVVAIGALALLLLLAWLA